VCIPPGGRISDRCIATGRLAKFFGIEDFIIPAVRARFSYDGETLYGIKMPPAKGVSYSDLSALEVLSGCSLKYTPKAARQLTQLVMFDFICGQIDRHSKNLKLITDIEFDHIESASDKKDTYKVLGIYAIDHDLSFGTNTYEDIKKRVSAGRCICPEFLGEMQYTAIDQKLCDRLFEAEDLEIKNLLSDLLSEEELSALFDRVEGLKSAILKEQKKEEELKASGKEFFSRFITSDEMYEKYLLLMEEHAGDASNDMRFSCRPSYLKKYILTHEAFEKRP
jgi:hypothetical protein